MAGTQEQLQLAGQFREVENSEAYVRMGTVNEQLMLRLNELEGQNQKLRQALSSASSGGNLAQAAQSMVVEESFAQLGLREKELKDREESVGKVEAAMNQKMLQIKKMDEELQARIREVEGREQLCQDRDLELVSMCCCCVFGS